MSRVPTLRIFVALALSGVHCARADQALEDRLRDQLKQAVTQVRQLQIENASLKADAAKAAPAAAAPAAAPATVDQGELDDTKAALQQQSDRSAALEAQLEKAKQALAKWQQSYDQAVALARSRDADAKKADALRSAVVGHVDSCEKNNAALIVISNELLDRYKNKGVFEAARHKEPLLGLQRVELERLAQEYHARIVDATVHPLDPEALAPSAPAAVQDAPATPAPQEKQP